MWFWYGLLSAAVGAVAVITQQKALGKIRSLILMWAISFFPIPLCLLFIPRQEIRIDGLFFIGTVGSALVFLIAKILNFVILKRSALSHVFPLSSLSTLFTYILGVIFLGENLTLAAIIGIYLSVIGVYLLQVHKHKSENRNLVEPIKILFSDRYSLLFIFAMFLTGVSSIFDKTGIMHTFPQIPAYALLAENIVMAGVLTVILFIKDKHWLAVVKDNFWTLLFNGLIYGMSALMTFYGFASGPVALVSAVKKMQILFVLVLGYYIFRDRPPKTIWWGAVLMIAGVAFTRL